MLDEIQKYRKSSILMAASQLGIFEWMEKGVTSIQNLAMKSGTNPTYLEPLLMYLEAYVYIERDEKGWRLNDDFKKTGYGSLKANKEIIAYEAYIFQYWMTPDKIIASLQASDDHRPFDEIQWTKEGKLLYKNVTYSHNLNYLCIYLIRYLKKYSIKTVYCVGEGSSYLYRVIKKKDSGIARTNQPGGADAILIFNRIHYLCETEIEKIIQECGKPVHFIIADFFHDRQDAFRNGLLIDWLTHGGVNFLNLNKVIDFCEKNDLEILENRYLKKIHTNILVITHEEH